MRRPDGVTVIAIYHFVIAIPSLLGACAILVFAIPPVLFSGDSVSGIFWALFGLGFALLATAGGGVLSLIAGWGLLALKEWARWLVIVLAILSLVAFPIGTVIGGFIIWYLLQEEARQAFLAAT